MEMAADSRDVSAPRWARLWVVVFLAAFAICALGGIEAWPLTGWRLFSEMRHEKERSWQATIVRAGGGETPMPFRAMGRAYGHAPQVLPALPTLPRARRDAVCSAWLARARIAAGVDGVRVRVYRVSRDLADRNGPRGVTGHPRLLLVCGG